MILTGKCREDFEEWLEDKRHFIISVDGTDEFWAIWYNCSKAMKYGVYVDFFDSVGIVSEATPLDWFEDFSYYYGYTVFKRGLVCPNLTGTKSLNEAREAAIKKANELYNKKN